MKSFLYVFFMSEIYSNGTMPHVELPFFSILMGWVRGGSLKNFIADFQPTSRNTRLKFCGESLPSSWYFFLRSSGNSTRRKLYIVSQVFIDYVWETRQSFPRVEFPL